MFGGGGGRVHTHGRDTLCPLATRGLQDAAGPHEEAHGVVQRGTRGSIGNNVQPGAGKGGRQESYQMWFTSQSNRQRGEDSTASV